MPLRLVSAVFFEPKHKFIVIYQNGSLWQLPRMKIDIASWRNRKSYTGSKACVYLLKDQTITDIRLAKIIPTQNFPKSLSNINLPKFESWWVTNSHAWLTEQNKINTVQSDNDKTIDTSTQQIQNKKTGAKSAEVIAKPIKSNPNTMQVKTVNKSKKEPVEKTISSVNQSKQPSSISTKANNGSKRELSFLAQQYLEKQETLQGKKDNNNTANKSISTQNQEKSNVRDNLESNTQDRLNTNNNSENTLTEKKIIPDNNESQKTNDSVLTNLEFL